MMRRLILCGLFLILATSLGFAAEPGLPGKPSIWVEGDSGYIDPTLDQLGQALTRLAEKVQPSVVDIRVIIEPMSVAEGGSQTPRSKRGSGFIISPQGYILTANHVVEGGSDFEVRLPNRQRLGAQVIASDSVVDLAIIKVDRPGDL